MDEIAKIRGEILRTGILLLEKNLVAGTWGNISSRIPDTDLLAITPSGRDYRSLQMEDIVVVDKKGNIVDGQLTPSSEMPLHLEIYHSRQDVKAIVHTHSVFASACAVARQAIPPIIEDLVQITGGSVEVAEYALPGTETLAKNAVLALADKGAVLLANHGLLGCGRSVSEAMTVCELVEKAAEILVYAKQLGSVHILSGEDVQVMHDFYVEHYRQRQGGNG